MRIILKKGEVILDFNMFDNMMNAPDMMNGKRPGFPPSGTSMSRFPKETPIAMAYVPFQEWEELYSDDEGLKNGTMFPSLNKPFLAWKGDYDE